ncbi:MAG: hypothetical protein KDA90_03625 [Planctomycetaceae bacterium]|nr:hypothetical protein [Planctomycetaceae bacterium]
MNEVQASFWTRWRTRIRRAAVILTGCIFVVLLLQNLEPVEFQVLLITMTMPRAIMLLAVAATAFICGAVWSRSGRR